jgi:hypothetical protein
MLHEFQSSPILWWFARKKQWRQEWKTKDLSNTTHAVPHFFIYAIRILRCGRRHASLETPSPLQSPAIIPIFCCGDWPPEDWMHPPWACKSANICIASYQAKIQSRARTKHQGTCQSEKGRSNRDKQFVILPPKLVIGNTGFPWHNF